MTTKQQSELLARLWMFVCCFGLLFVQSCAKTEVAKQLSKTFDVPVEDPLKKGLKKVNKPKIKSSLSKSSKTNLTKAVQNNDGVDQSIQKITKGTTKKRSSFGRSIPLQPYRITIKLLRADPSAPAERVTNALRMAGINFEVERIERFESSSSSKIRIERRGDRP